MAGPVSLRSPPVPPALILRLKYGARRIDGNYPADIMTRDDFERVQATTSYGKYKATTYIVYVLMKELLNFWSFRLNSYRFQTSVLAWRDSYSVGLVIQRLVAGNSAPVLVQKIVCLS